MCVYVRVREKFTCDITDGCRHWIAAVSRLENARANQLSSIIGYMGLTIKNVTNLARAGRVTSRVQAWFWYNHAWTFTCYTNVFTGDHRAFGNLRIDPSNRYIRKSSNEILAVQGRFPNSFNRSSWHSDPCHTQPVSKSTDMKVSTSQR